VVDDAAAVLDVAVVGPACVDDELDPLPPQPATRTTTAVAAALAAARRTPR
jgi:hypothetical protein